MRKQETNWSVAKPNSSDLYPGLCFLPCAARLQLLKVLKRSSWSLQRAEPEPMVLHPFPSSISWWSCN